MASLLHGIAAKIFGLAVMLLLISIGLVALLVSQIADTSRSMQVLREHELPLQAAIASLDEIGLRRRLAFERWFGALNRLPPNQEIVAEASRNYRLFTDTFVADIAETRRVADAFPPDAQQQAKLAEIRVLLAQIDEEYLQLTERQKELLELQLAGEHDVANHRILLLNDVQNTVQRQRAALLAAAMTMMADSATALDARQSAAYRLTVAATISAVLLGLAFAALITVRLTAPVRALTDAVGKIRGGTLGAALPVLAQDEIGELTAAFNYFVDELRSKEHLRRTFGRYIDPRVMDHVLGAGGGAATAGERRRMTIQFADLVGFTELSERLTPSLMVKVLNRHFTLQAEAVQQQRGVIDKFVGDAVLAFWGAPFVDEAEQVELAVRSALAQVAAMDVLRAELPELTGLRRETPQVSLRVGLATGDVLVGNIGSDSICGFTVIGDTVNLASRIESINRLYGTMVLMGPTTAAAIDGQFEVREIDSVAVKGKRESTKLFELLGEAGKVESMRRSAYVDYARGLAAYRAGDWAAAEAGFGDCLKAQPGDGPSRLMLTRIAKLKDEPPAPDWDGTWVFDAK